MYPLSGRTSLLQSHNPQSGKEKFYPIRLFFMERWKILFQNETLEDIAKQLERNFDVNIIIKNDSLKQIPYHMAFVNNETLDDILSAMNLDGYLTIKRDGKIIEIY